MNRRGANLTGPLGGAMVARWGASSLVKSVQHVTIALSTNNSATSTIASVVAANTIVSFNRVYCNNTGSNNAPSAQIEVELTDATTLTANRVASSGVNAGVTVSVIEFHPGVLRSVQRGSIALSASVSTNTATVTSVDTNKAWLINRGTYVNVAAADAYILGRFLLSNATTITFERWTNDGLTTLTGFYDLVEFF